MHNENLAITNTLGARLMAIQAGLIAKQTCARPAARGAAMDRLMRGPDVELLYSTWTQDQQREFQQYMSSVCAELDVLSRSN